MPEEEKSRLDFDLNFLDKTPSAVPPKEETNEIAEKEPSKGEISEETVKPGTIADVQPWVRWCARYFDIFLFSLILGIVLGIFAPSTLEGKNDAVFGIVSLFIWIFIETILLSTWGTTPGKGLLRVRIRNSNGGKLTFSEALKRSFTVWIKGMGIGFPIIALFTLSGSYDNLRKKGITEWDEKGNFVVTHQKIGAIRAIVAISVFIIFILLIWIGNQK